MNEDYLKQFRRMPDAGFFERIHARLHRKERIHAIKRYAVFLVLTLMFAFGMLMTFSSTVRAEILQKIEKIAGMQYEVTSDYPGDPDNDVIIIEPEHLSLDDARSRFLSPLQLPAYIPQDYERSPDTELYVWGNGSPSLHITWHKWEENELSGMIGLDIAQCLSDSLSCGMIVGEGALEEITLNGKPATLIRGSWSYDTQQYDLSAGVDIQWRYDENTVYRLFSYTLPLEELIRMAESIP